MQFTTYNKYRNRKVTLDGIKFSSQKEADKYWQLKHDPRVEHFELQPKFLLQKAFVKDGHKYRAIYYIADFEVLYKDGTVEIIDVKGIQTDVFKLKAKLFDFIYPELTLVIE